MPNWRKVIVSGSDAYLTSVITPPGIVNTFTASYAVASLSSSNALVAVTASHLFGTASQATTASYSEVARTSSFSQTASLANSAQRVAIPLSSGYTGFLEAAGTSYQLRHSNSGAHIILNATNVTSFSQICSFGNGVNITPGGNSTTQALGVTVGSYPSSTLATFSSGSTIALTISGSGMRGTGSFSYQGSITATTFTGSLQGTASMAVSASWAPTTSPFPFTGSAQITGSLSVTGSVTITGSLTLQDVLVAPYLSIANYSSDAAAAAAGIPLWGIYRTGNMLIVRMT